MSYEDDELERMRARREQRRNGDPKGGRSARTGESRRGSQDTGEPFRSGYSGPRERSGKNSAGRGRTTQKAVRRRRPDKKKRIMIIAAEILILLVLVVGAAGWYVYDQTFGSFAKVEFNKEEVENDNLSEQQLESMKGYLTIACFGVDSRKENGKLNVGKGTNADVNMICSINLENGEIRLVSVFRDSYLNINDKNSYNKLNAAYAQGGPEQAVKALNKNLGLNITQYATFNWKAVADAINILGGVDITISDVEFSWINAFITETVKETGLYSTPLAHAGEVHLDGVQAVAYGRLRLGDTDYARTERQRIILSQAFEKAKKADLGTLKMVVSTVMPQLATNLTLSDLVPLMGNISSYHISDTAGFPFARGEMDIGKIGDCVVPQTLEFNVKELHKFLFGIEDYAVPSNVKEYSRHISDTTGLYSEGKVISHVPVDQGVNANSYARKKALNKIKKEQEKEAAERATATEESTDESTEESTDESSTDESGTDDETFDPEEEWPDWDDDWDDEEWGDGPGGGSSEGPGSRPTRPVFPGKTTEADDGNEATGPGATGPAKNPSDSSKSPTNPTKNPSGTTKNPSDSTKSPSDSTKSTERASEARESSPAPISPGGNSPSGNNGSQSENGGSAAWNNSSSGGGGQIQAEGNGPSGPGA